MRMLRVGQITLQGSAVSLEDFVQIAKDRKLDVALIQEPYSRQDRVPQIKNFRLYYVPDKLGAVVMVMKECVEVLFIWELSSQHHVCGKIIYGEQALYILNSYFKFSEDIGSHLLVWERCVRYLGDRALILAGDVKTNLHYGIAHTHTHTHRRREDLEAFLIVNDIFVANEEGNLATFSTYGERVRGQGPTSKMLNISWIPSKSERTLVESNIDVTIRNRKASIRDWRVIDHCLISFDVGGIVVRTVYSTQSGYIMPLTSPTDGASYSLQLGGPKVQLCIVKNDPYVNQYTPQQKIVIPKFIQDVHYDRGVETK